MVREEFLVISVLILQIVNTFLNLRRVIKSRCISAVDIEKSTQGTNVDHIDDR